MMKREISLLAVIFLTTAVWPSYAADEDTAAPQATQEYKIGVEDILDINILQPEQMTTTVSVAPDGTVTVPYIGSVAVKDMGLTAAQDLIQKRLADGYMKYPVVSLSLRESRSRKFFVYGEVMKPGTYPLNDNVTVLRAISIAGGFSKFGSSSRVKVLRLKEGGVGYDTMKVDMNAAMNGNPQADVTLKPEDIVVVSEGIF